MTDVSEGFSRLRELLFDKETARLETVDQRVEKLESRLKGVETETADEQRERLNMLRQLETLLNRAGTEERFTSSIASVLDQAMTEAEVTRQPELARAIAPLVVTTIKTELRNSQDEMVEALYPITGRLVQSYVAGAMKDLADQINRRMEQNAVMLRLRSWSTGKPLSDVAMADTQRLQLEEIYLIRRGSGELLARWPEGRTLSNSDVHMTGLMSAITEFATEAFGDDGGELRSFEADDGKIFLRASPTYLLAAKCTGHAPESIARIIDDAFFNLLGSDTFREDVATSAKPEGAAQLTAMAGAMREKVDKSYDDLNAANTDYGIFKLLLFIIALPIFAWAGWSAYTNLEEARVRNLASSAIKATSGLSGYRTELEVGYRGQTVAVRGLTPDADVRGDLLERLRRNLPATTRLETELAVLPAGAPDARPLVDRLRRQLTAVEAELKRAALVRTLARSEARLQQAMADTRGLEADVREADQRASVAAARGIAAKTLDRLKQLNARIAKLRAAPRASEFAELRAPLEGLSQEMAGVQQTLSGRPADNPAAAAASNRDVTIAAEDLSANVERFASTITALRQVANIKPVAPKTVVQVREFEPTVTPDEKLERWVRRNAIFFANGTDFRASDQVARRLDALADLIKDAGLLVRIVGFTDERGGLTRNNTLALERARRVYSELRSRGVPRARLIAVGRGTGRDLSPSVGEASPNRRVEFEIGFIGEGVAPQ